MTVKDFLPQLKDTLTTLLTDVPGAVVAVEDATSEDHSTRQAKVTITRNGVEWVGMIDCNRRGAHDAINDAQPMVIAYLKTILQG
jgi:hypothetical protein